ncbi:RAMP superfamily CRISPR-associated protein [Arhodomonas sp. KWT]|uniref:RAMP superfamily CRISPR-associated protein n=1 Tax=Arhodomonas sp. KWT TaxID=2679915 RepID=UPI0013D8069F|nr:RAMP superfamily CRISPR-associated protein [Arhodomonas sp. KWT]
MSMEQRQHTITFLTPAFLGDARQNAAWRTPPFKAELRRWWRMAIASHGHDLATVRRLEGELFGDAAGNSGKRSALRLRLNAWKRHTEPDWHLAVDRNQLRMASGLSAAGYLGFGRAETQRKETDRKTDPAIPAGESATLRMAWPAGDDNDALEQALGLMHRFGTVGGRNRNGWGSYEIESPPKIHLDRYLVDWRDAVNNHDWTIGVGRDKAGPLVWQTRPQRSWEGAIRVLAEVRKALCGEAKQQGRRPLLSYPVTKGNRPDWDKLSARIPNSLRFKVIKGEKGLHGQIAHVPCGPADFLRQKFTAQEEARFPDLWEACHELLDDEFQKDLQRVSQ